MATGPRYKVAFRRRREGKTDYHQRLKLIVSKKPRLVVRKTLNQIIAQVIIAKPDGDYVLASATSKDLTKDFDYKGATKNTSAAYLTGMLAGFRALEAGVEEAVLDAGLATNRKGSRVYAALKGAIDAGLEIPCDEEIFPSDERIRGEHVAGNSESSFSEYEKRGLKASDLPAHFDEVKNKITSEFEGE
ncbi:50S ribosomal protein L18 [Methanocella sp. CWC-04]|uniref:Large ribosomal subunit protein uL18 n=1 Tax=Methanooceanicella nereidis TaxID=2052831 RepID=A0AAP2R9P2_9EURY|nr:50S ribosomal protein L18 [Methanocella sp. CWC-04]MCD1293494.1 50S ribosomal protein L18 [Methanocella sp. CWC-04]